MPRTYHTKGRDAKTLQKRMNTLFKRIERENKEVLEVTQTYDEETGYYDAVITAK